MPRAEFEAFVAAQVPSSRRVPSRSAPPLARCLEVRSVEPGSVGARIGIGVGDLLVSMNGQSASLLQPKLWRIAGRLREYIFYSPSAGERIEATTTGIDPGIELRRTPDLVKATYKPADRDPEPLTELWEAGAWSTLLPQSEAALKAGPPDTPLLALWGSALWHVGRRAEAMEASGRYIQQYSRGWVMQYLSIASHTLGLARADEGKRDVAIEIMKVAYRNTPMARIADSLEKLGAPRPAPPLLWTDRTTPGDYALPPVDDAANPPPATRTLSSLLGALGPGQLALVCLLDGYRGNGPYNEFMKRYRNYVRDFRPWIGPLHVITEKRPRPQDRAYYFEAEDKARGEGAPFEVLFDERGDVGAQYNPNGSPFVMAIDRDGRIRSEGQMEGPDVWRGLRGANG